tara:strand:- start:35 stop:652 length:618 start_codon:yes stop_codon:yes gene_type:complete
MSHRNLKYLNDNRIIYRRYSSDIPTKQYSWGWHYADGTYGYYAMFNSKAKINTIRSLKWHLLTLWYLNPDLDKNEFTKLAKYIICKSNEFVTFNIGIKLITNIIEEVYRQDLDTPPKNRLRKIVFKDGSGLSTVEKLSLVGSIIGKSKIKKDDIYEAMLYIHEESKITVKKLAKALKCTERTIYRNMCSELKEEKSLLNKQYEKI